jgi:hypothetical protein
MEIINLPKIAYSVEELQRLEKEGLLKDNLDAINYVFSYYYEVDCGQYYFYDVETDKFKVKSKEDFGLEVTRKLSALKIGQTLGKNPKKFNIICQLGKPRLFKYNKQYYINDVGAFKHYGIYKQFDEYDQPTKDAVFKMIDFMRVVSCRNDENVLKGLLLWYSQIGRGMKTQLLIARRTTGQGTGKSTEPDFMMEYVFGYNVCTRITDLTPFITPNNKILFGKIFVNVEDLENLADADYKRFSTKLKTYVTEKTAMYAEKYEKQFPSDMITNFSVTTNHSLKDSSGRRVIELDISTEKKQDYAYFEDLRETCFNDKCGEAFYSYLMTKITDEESKNFFGQRDFPETNNKRVAISANLDYVYQYIKEEYILKNKPIKRVKRAEFYLEYCEWCITNHYRSGKKETFYQKLEEVKIVSKNSNGERFDYSIDFLKAIATKEKWICKFDDFEPMENDEKAEISPLDFGVEPTKDTRDDEIKALKQEIERLKKLLETPKLEVKETLEIKEPLEVKKVEVKKIEVKKPVEVKEPLKKNKSKVKTPEPVDTEEIISSIEIF